MPFCRLLPIYLIGASLLHVWFFHSQERCNPEPMGFSGSNLVHVQDQGAIPLYKLKRNDFVQVRGKHGHTSYSRVHAIASWNESTEFLVFQTTKNSPKLVVTPSQLLYVYQGNEKRSVPARDIKDTLISDTGQSVHFQRYRRRATRRGSYAPLTTTGDLILNGIQVSCYAATRFYPELLHLYLAPYRVLNSWTPFTVISPEKYLEQFSCQSSTPWQLLLLFPWVCFAYGLELMLQSRQSILFTIVLTGVAWAWRQIKQHQHEKKRKKAVGSK